MIEQILNRTFVLEALEAVKSDLEQLLREPPDRRRVGDSGLSKPEIEETLHLLGHVQAAEERQSSGQLGFAVLPADRRGGPRAAPIDDTAFFSRDAVISNFQSVLEEYYETQEPDQVELVKARRDRRETEEASPVTNRHLKNWQPRKENKGRRLFNKFSVTDIRWVGSKFAEAIRLFRGKHALGENPARVKMNDRVRLVMVGDWGTGLPRAQKVARQMRQILEEGQAAAVEQHVVHLGDVYYSGWEKEYRKRFLADGMWPVRLSEEDTFFSWCLNGNHDMYSGGQGYFDFLLTDPRFKRQNQTSYFSLFNSNWTILGLDTAWEDHSLANPQAVWVGGEASTSNGKKILLLSHHQLFSAYEGGGEKIEERLRPLIQTERFLSWFWGHEHRCMTFRRHMGVRYGRCVGHGGVPVYMFRGINDPVPSPGESEFREFIQSGLERWAKFGFVVLDFEGRNLSIRYLDEDGKLHRSETIS